MSFLRKVDSFLNRVEGGILVLFLAAMIVMAFLQVVLRNGFNSTIIWVDILLRHLVLWIGFLGSALAASNDRHINIDALTRFLSPRIRSMINVLTNVFAVIVCFLLLSAAVTFVGNEIADKTTVYAEIPEWYSQIIIPVGFGLLIFHFLVRAVVNAQGAFRKAGNP